MRNKKKLKYLFIIIPMILLISFVFVSCNGNNKKSVNSDNNKKTVPSTQPKSITNTNSDGTLSFKMLKDGTYSVATVYENRNKINGEFKIPNEFNGKKVTQIAENSFSNIDNLTGITIPDTISTISDEAFQSDKNLKTVTIGKSVTTIGKDCFHWCPKLESLSILSIKTPAIGYGSFDSGRFGSNYTGGNMKILTLDCEDITEEFSSRLPIATGVSQESQNTITTITLGNNVKRVEDYVFSENGFSKLASLETLNLGDSVQYLGSCLFNRCKSLESVVIPISVIEFAKKTQVGGGIFDNNTKIYYQGNQTQWKKIINSSEYSPVQYNYKAQ